MERGRRARPRRSRGVQQARRVTAAVRGGREGGRRGDGRDGEGGLGVGGGRGRRAGLDRERLAVQVLHRGRLLLGEDLARRGGRRASGAFRTASEEGARCGKGRRTLDRKTWTSGTSASANGTWNRRMSDTSFHRALYLDRLISCLSGASGDRRVFWLPSKQNVTSDRMMPRNGSAGGSHSRRRARYWRGRKSRSAKCQRRSRVAQGGEQASGRDGRWRGCGTSRTGRAGSRSRAWPWRTGPARWGVKGACQRAGRRARAGEMQRKGGRLTSHVFLRRVMLDPLRDATTAKALLKLRISSSRFCPGGSR